MEETMDGMDGSVTNRMNQVGVIIVGVVSVYMQYMVYNCVYYCDTCYTNALYQVGVMSYPIRIDQIWTFNLSYHICHMSYADWSFYYLTYNVFSFYALSYSMTYDILHDTSQMREALIDTLLVYVCMYVSQQ
jgi:hypothetical protein